MKKTTIGNIIVIANEASMELGAKVAVELGTELTPTTKQYFADGEIHHSFSTDLASRDVIIIGSNFNDTAHLELIDLIDGSRCWNADSVNVVIPFLGYSTMERFKPDSGEIPKGITRTRQIFRARPDFVAFVDLHSEAVMHAHDANIYTKHIQTNQLIADKIKTLGIDNIVLVSPDYGRSKWVAQLATLLGVPHTAADKDRFAMDKTLVGQVASVVQGKTAIICDDMIRTGGSILQTAQRCREAGAVDTIIMATHLVLCGNSHRRFHDAGIRRIIGADTYPGVSNDALLDLYSVAPLIAKTLITHLAIDGEQA